MGVTKSNRGLFSSTVLTHFKISELKPVRLGRSGLRILLGAYFKIPCYGGWGTWHGVKHRLTEMLTAEMLGKWSRIWYSMGSLDKPGMIYLFNVGFVEESSIDQVCFSQSIFLALDTCFCFLSKTNQWRPGKTS